MGGLEGVLAAAASWGGFPTPTPVPSTIAPATVHAPDPPPPPSTLLQSSPSPPLAAPPQQPPTNLVDHLRKACVANPSELAAALENEEMTFIDLQGLACGDDGFQRFKMLLVESCGAKFGSMNKLFNYCKTG